MAGHPWTYEFLQWLLADGQVERVGEVLRAQRPRQWLDIGCGTGRFSRLSDGCYVGVDLSWAKVRWASRHRIRPHRYFMVADLDQPAWKPRAFSHATIFDVIHHLDDGQLSQLLSQVRTWIREKLILADEVPRPGHPLAQLFYALDEGKHFRTWDAQVAALERDFKIERAERFISRRGIYEHTLFVCRPK